MWDIFREEPYSKMLTFFQDSTKSESFDRQYNFRKKLGQFFSNLRNPVILLVFLVLNTSVILVAGNLLREYMEYKELIFMVSFLLLFFGNALLIELVIARKNFKAEEVERYLKQNFQFTIDETSENNIFELYNVLRDKYGEPDNLSVKLEVARLLLSEEDQELYKEQQQGQIFSNRLLDTVTILALLPLFPGMLFVSMAAVEPVLATFISDTVLAIIMIPLLISIVVFILVVIYEIKWAYKKKMRQWIRFLDTKMPVNVPVDSELDENRLNNEINRYFRDNYNQAEILHLS